MGYSTFLPGLFLYGYRDRVAVNLGFRRDFRQGPIRYLRGDITKLAFGDAHFGMVFCQSVIEHGVPLERYFAEMARVVKPGGLLVTSTDYWEPKLMVQDARAYGEPVDVFDAGQIRQTLELARQAGWEPTCPPEFDCRDRVVYWERMDIRFTFYSLVLRRCLHREDGSEGSG